MIINVLHILWYKLSSSRAIQNIVDNIIASPDHENPQELMGLSNTEWTAYADGLSLDELARWRYEGWPTECACCGKTINPKKYGWMVRKNKVYHIYHVQCLVDKKGRTKKTLRPFSKKNARKTPKKI